MKRLLLQVWDLEWRGGAASLVWSIHADVRVVVGLQVHGGDVTCFTAVSVKENKNKGLSVLKGLAVNH